MTKKDGIRLHPEFGVNPSVMLCFWCGEPNGIAFLGYNKGNEAPKTILGDYDPCPACADRWKNGIVLIGCVSEPVLNNQKPISTDGGEPLYPTGTWAVASERIIEVMPEEIRAKVREKGRCLMGDSVLSNLLNTKNETSKEETNND